jgi:predicted ribosome quality control (RQC) complex YloA/Tae2 family protein
MLPDGSAAVSEPFEIWASEQEALDHNQSLKERLLRDLRKRRKKEQQLLQGLEKDLSDAEDAQLLRSQGELVLQNLKTIPRGASDVCLIDYSKGEPVEVQLKLDPKRTPLAFAQSLFKEAKKRDRSLTKVAGRLAETEARMRDLVETLLAIEATDDLSELEQLQDFAVKKRWVSPPAQDSQQKASKSKPEPIRRKPYRTFVSVDGLEILVGRTAADNDELSLRIARGNDLWLHVGDYAGSHVVVRGVNEVPNETLLDAATLALHYSQSPKGSGGEVSYTRAKFVKKFKGARPGQVQLAERKSLRIRPDSDRLERILKTGGERSTP